MQIRWYGQAAFALTGEEHTVFIDPFGNMESMAQRGLVWNYPPIVDASAEILLVTHEHADHNGVEVVKGVTHTIRSTAGSFSSPIGTVLAVASEHDPLAGTQRGPNAIFVFELDGLRVAHFGDFGQKELRSEQAEAIGKVDLAFVPVGAGPTIDGGRAWEIAGIIGARWVVPMHYRTPSIGFLETEATFAEAAGNVERIEGSSVDVVSRPEGEPLAIILEAPTKD